MKIKTKEDLLKMIDKVLGTVSKDERYPESANALQMAKENAEYEDLGGLEDMLCRELHEADAAYPMHPEVAKLITDIYARFTRWESFTGTDTMWKRIRWKPS